MSSQRIGKYACLELERKYLLRDLPQDLDPAGPHWTIVDHYLPGTRLRLRRMTHSQSNAVQYKLGQKYRAPEQAVTAATMTNLYLTRAEYDQLRILGGLELQKQRYGYLYLGRRYSIDLFLGHLNGLILAETECETQAEVNGLQLPDFAVADVTGDPFWGGGALAAVEGPAFSEELENASMLES